MHRTQRQTYHVTMEPSLVRECEAVNLIEQSKPYANSVRPRTAAAARNSEFTPTIVRVMAAGGRVCKANGSRSTPAAYGQDQAEEKLIRRRSHMKGHERLEQSCVRLKPLTKNI